MTETKSMRYQWEDAVIIMAAMGMLPDGARGTALCLAHLIDWTGNPAAPELKMSNHRAAAYVGLSRSTLQRHRAPLEEAGLIEVRRTAKGHKNWFATLPAGLDSIKEANAQRREAIKEAEERAKDSEQPDATRPTAKPGESEADTLTPSISQVAQQPSTEPVEASQQHEQQPEPVGEQEQAPQGSHAPQTDAPADLTAYELAMAELSSPEGAHPHRKAAEQRPKEVLAMAMDRGYLPGESGVVIRVDRAMADVGWKIDMIERGEREQEEDRRKYADCKAPEPDRHAVLSGW